MFEHLQIRNFRGLKSLDIKETSRINLIAGRNNSGKTSLLESILLLSGWGNPNLAPNICASRGMVPATGPLEAQRDFLWKPLFSDFDIDQEIRISGKSRQFGKLNLTVTLPQANTTEIQFDDLKQILTSRMSDRDTLEFLFTDSSRRSLRGSLQLAGQGVHVTQPNTRAGFPATYLSSRTGGLQEDAARLGQLRTRKQGKLVVEALQNIERNLQSIEDNTASGSPMIWGDVGLPELIPLPALGEGMTRIARLVLAIATSPGGVVLVDEIENGLHHSVLPKVWESVGLAARRFDTQVFATTHSLECVEAAHSSLMEFGLLLYRLDADENSVRCTTYDQSERAAAIKHGLEVR